MFLLTLEIVVFVVFWSVERVAETIKSCSSRCAILADGQPHVRIGHVGGADGIEERVRHHNDTLFDGHPAAEGQIARDRPIGHIDAVMFDWRAAVLRLVVVSRLVLVRDQVYTLGDIGHEEVAALDEHRGPREGHLADGGRNRVSVRLEYGPGRLNEALAGLVKVWLS